MSFVHVGQIWYSFGWETQLLETGFIAVFIVPFLNPKPFPKSPPPTAIIWVLRWLAFRVYLGAGLIKIRGSGCWRDLTCTLYHYETQPIPNPLSRALHFFPKWYHKFEVLFSHFAQLVAPFFIFTPAAIRHIAGFILLFYQIFLVFTGNYAFLNWVTILPLIAIFDDDLSKTTHHRWVA